MRFLIIANCQGNMVATLLAADGRHQVDYRVISTVGVDSFEPDDLMRYDVILAQDFQIGPAIAAKASKNQVAVFFPPFLFDGLTPDQCLVGQAEGRKVSSRANIPRVMIAAWARGLSRSETKSLYNPEFLDLMGYRADFTTRCNVFIERLARYMSFEQARFLFERWYERGVFTHQSNHPKSFVTEDIVRTVLEPYDIALPPYQVSDRLEDPLGKGPMNPNLNHPAADNRLDRQDQVYRAAKRLLSLREMIAQCFVSFENEKDAIRINPRDLERFDKAYEAWTGRTPEPLVNPYRGRPDHTMWARAVSRPAPHEVAPAQQVTPVIGPETRVATAGSCFAQHVARAMVENGLNYYVAEPAPEGMDEKTAQERTYGLFSARYGNIYSTRQLLQLIRRAYGRFTPIETAWETPKGWIDPFRPNIGQTFDSPEAVEAAREDHLAAVRTMFETLDVFVFTLGLTEGWVDRRDGAAFPVTPGSVTKAANPAHFEFRNLDYAQVKRDLVDFLGELVAVNPSARVIFTVSPVPLIATYSENDVLTATTYSKSVLRAAAEDVATAFSHVQYFPSYEIITGSFNRGAYFGPDLREVQPEGVAHVMGIFLQRLVHGGETEPRTREAAPDASVERIAAEMAEQSNIVCDEELLMRDV